MTAPQTLHRFYDQAGALLYAGVTADHDSHWAEHVKGEPWWREAATCKLEHFDGREAAAAAERAAIISEKPRHDIARANATGPGRATGGPQPERTSPVRPGDWAALALRDGRCPAGRIESIDDTWVSVRHKDFNWGVLTAHVTAVRWSDIERLELAYPEDAVDRRMQDEHLEELQVAWTRTRFGKGDDPVEQARADYRRELDEQARQLRLLGGQGS